MGKLCGASFFRQRRTLLRVRSRVRAVFTDPDSFLNAPDVNAAAAAVIFAHQRCGDPGRTASDDQNVVFLFFHENTLRFRGSDHFLFMIQETRSPVNRPRGKEGESAGMGICPYGGKPFPRCRELFQFSGREALPLSLTVYPSKLYVCSSALESLGGKSVVTICAPHRSASAYLSALKSG